MLKSFRKKPCSSVQMHNLGGALHMKDGKKEEFHEKSPDAERWEWSRKQQAA